MVSLLKDSLDEDKLSFILSVGAERVPGSFRADNIREMMVLGSQIYKRTYWVEFETYGHSINWYNYDEMTLHIIQVDRLHKVDLTWKFMR